MADYDKGLLRSFRKNILTHISSHINPLEFYKGEFGAGFEFGQNVICPFHKDTDPSMHVYEAGNFKCFGCDAKGGGAVKFYELKYCNGSDSWAKAMIDMHERYIGPLVSEERIAQYENNLAGDADAIERIHEARGIRYSTLKYYRCGLDEKGKMLTIPYQSPYGLWTNMAYLNVFKDTDIKQRSWNLVVNKDGNKHRFDAGRVWPAGVVCSNNDVFMFEGYYDALLALSLEVAGVTIGGASQRIKGADYPLFSGKRVNIVYDKDGAGRTGAAKIAHQLARQKLGKEIRIIELPGEDGVDFADWVLKGGGSKEKLIELVKSTEPYELPYVDSLPDMQRELVKQDKDIKILTYRKARSDTYNEMYRMEALVVGKDTNCITLPNVVKVSCPGAGGKNCRCVINDSPLGSCDIEIDITNPVIANFVGMSKQSFRQEMKSYLGMSARCPIDCQVVRSYSATWLYVGEPLSYEAESSGEDSGDQGPALCINNVNANSIYVFKGYTVTHPKTGVQFPLLYEALPTATELDTFRATDAVCGLLEPFKMIGKEDLWEGFMSYYDHLSRTVTGIWGRPLTHMAADLVFFSPVSFYFQGQYIRKGSLDVVIFGDTRCGKGAISEGLHRFYEAGEVISGENCSMMNLLGGIKRESTFSGVAWGRLALRHRDTVIIDEMSGIDKDEIGRLSRIRSEGIANVDKYGHHQSANANVGILWLTNPRDSGRLLRTYNYGLEAMYSLQPKTEDLARFDYAHAVAVGEVPSSVINRSVGTKKEGCKHTTQQCNTLITWAKSRKPSEIRFTEACVNYILNMAQRLGKEYSTSIPLLLAENVRVKMAKIAASIAARIWNHHPDDPGVLLVDERCAQTAVRLLRELYDSSIMGYRDFSKVEHRAQKVDTGKLSVIFNTACGQSNLSMRDLCQKIIMDGQIVEKDIKLLFADDEMAAKQFLAGMKRANALVRKYQHYVKQEGFIKWLKEQIEQRTTSSR